MSENTEKPVGDRRAVADARGIRRNTTDAGRHEAQDEVIVSGVWYRATSLGITANLCSSDLGVAASASGSALHDGLEKFDALKQTALRGVEPLLTNGAGIGFLAYGSKRLGEPRRKAAAEVVPPSNPLTGPTAPGRPACASGSLSSRDTADQTALRGKNT
jgi:hypothetical protein